MTTVASPTQVRCADDGRLTARCLVCQVDLVQTGDDVAAALRALDEAHPAVRAGRHSAEAPAGWQRRCAVGSERARQAEAVWPSTLSRPAPA